MELARQPPSTPTPTPTPTPVHLPIDVILYFSEFLEFQDFRSLIESIWPDGVAIDSVKRKLWRLSTHTLDAKFFNGKRLSITYNFDAARPKDERVLIYTESLRPLFDGILPIFIERYKSISELVKFVTNHVHVDVCLGCRRACCPRHLLYADDEDAHGAFVKPPLDEYPYGYFQHYCPQHVISWLTVFLRTAILLTRSKRLFDEDIAEQYSFYPEDIVYFQTGKRATLKRLLKSALEIGTVVYDSSSDEEM